MAADLVDEMDRSADHQSVRAVAWAAQHCRHALLEEPDSLSTHICA